MKCPVLLLLPNAHHRVVLPEASTCPALAGSAQGGLLMLEGMVHLVRTHLFGICR